MGASRSSINRWRFHRATAAAAVTLKPQGSVSPRRSCLPPSLAAGCVLLRLSSPGSQGWELDLGWLITSVGWLVELGSLLSPFDVPTIASRCSTWGQAVAFLHRNFRAHFPALASLA